MKNFTYLSFLLCITLLAPASIYAAEPTTTTVAAEPTTTTVAAEPIMTAAAEPTAPWPTEEPASSPVGHQGRQEFQEAPQQYYFGFGPGLFSNMNSNALGMVLTPGVMWSLDPQFDLGVTADMAFSLHHNDTRFFSPQLKGRYFIQPQDPYYVGLGLGYGYAHSHKSTNHPSDTTSGFASSLTVGAKFYRASSVQFSVELDHQFIWSSSDNGTPQMTFIKVGVHFY